jgi:two-component system, LytTR family, response regulator LytT
MKVLIIEDEELAFKRLKKLLLEAEPGIDIEGPLDTVKNSILFLSEKQDFDLIFLDIQLADGKCFSIFDHLNIAIPIIFTTAYDEYAIKAFELNSIDYLLKPINQAKLSSSLEKYRKFRQVFNQNKASDSLSELLSSLKLNQKVVYQSRFLINKGETLFPVSIQDIAYFYAEDKVVFLVQSDGMRLIINNSLEELEHRIDPKLFFRVNRQFLISISSIEKAHNYFNYKLKLDLIPASQEVVVVSKARTSDFKLWMNG